MRKVIRINLEELAQLRERAAQLCEETQALIDEYRRLRGWCDGMRPRVLGANFTPSIEVVD